MITFDKNTFEYNIEYLTIFYDNIFCERYWDFIKTNAYEDLDWILISENLNITWEIICNNPDEEWD